jgi:serine/threonine protein kinase
MFVRAGEWIDWEVYCARLLYPERPDVRAGPSHALILPKVPGVSLRNMVDRGDADLRKAFIIAARELSRVHRIHCNRYGAAWSHGDLHLDNILYDGDAERAVVIDFDTRHEFGVGETQRRSDDLKVVLLELIGLADETWTELATAFIHEYRDGPVLSELSRQLIVPRGLAKLLWFARTNCSALHRIEPRLQTLRAIIGRTNGTAKVL